MNWETLPYDHTGRWEKKYQSIMDPSSKVTWPQFIAEMVIYWRKTLIRNYAKITLGPKWSNSIQRQVRELNQQAANICNYFPHPDDEPLVVYAVKKYFREHRPCKIGQFRKTRVVRNKETGRERINITQDEKDVVLGINTELMKALKTRESYNLSSPEPKKTEEIKVDIMPSAPKKGSLAYAIALEKEISSKE